MEPPLRLLKGDPSRVLLPDTDRENGVGGGGRRIRCPRCGWEPGRDDRWTCTCLHVWNTFDTGGVCPGCGHTWDETQCLRCQAWSPHIDWYVDEGGPDA
jgi:hypothetical protein